MFVRSLDLDLISLQHHVLFSCYRLHRIYTPLFVPLPHFLFTPSIENQTWTIAIFGTFFCFAFTLTYVALIHKKWSESMVLLYRVGLAVKYNSILVLN